jgi:hypothetical protein
MLAAKWLPMDRTRRRTRSDKRVSRNNAAVAGVELPTSIGLQRDQFLGEDLRLIRPLA